MRYFGIAILLTAISVSGRMLCADEGVTVWATECIPVDLSVNECRLAVGEVAVWHTPDWCTGGTNVEGAVAVLKAVANPDTANASTTTVSLADGVNLGRVLDEAHGLNVVYDHGFLCLEALAVCRGHRGLNADDGTFANVIVDIVVPVLPVNRGIFEIPVNLAKALGCEIEDIIE